MDPKIIEGLRAAVDAAHPNPSLERAALLASLRAEEFWNSRAPQLTDEVLILRRLETFARALGALGGKALAIAKAGRLPEVLDELDAMRAKHSEGR
jgi:hypothetical protein